MQKYCQSGSETRRRVVQSQKALEVLETTRGTNSQITNFERLGADGIALLGCFRGASEPRDEPLTAEMGMQSSQLLEEDSIMEEIDLTACPVPGRGVRCEWRCGSRRERWKAIPESVGRMVNGPREPSLRRKVCRQRCNGLGVVTRIISEFDRNRFCRTLRNRIVKMLDGSLGLYALVEAHETDAFGKSCNEKRKILVFFQIWRSLPVNAFPTLNPLNLFPSPLNGPRSFGLKTEGVLGSQQRVIRSPCVIHELNGLGAFSQLIFCISMLPQKLPPSAGHRVEPAVCTRKR